ncbi:TetR/AcrR family transcriptional regulator [Anaerobacillus sp. CMMVII]|uniref:TetR/AcrR family transcriptional regulator n=1 Tax=Anaerobacillus sp. CMMVII TaxID=2755588 RepID=UPI0021B7BAD4|nr:TetR/AcrR family transcriptional regulator [Anaerobacillus sp. CMMVII]MCT8140183.1 TetR/AcrR family transcriptional regulator [Anaerobacillus sp. CMMVII]
MNDRKQHVIKMAHQLFIDRGFQATSIQDILDYSGISKGTFYNYFSSKNELLMALVKAIYLKMEKERDELLIGQDLSNIDMFIKQIEFQLNTNKKNKLFTLFEEVLISNDVELKQFIKEGQLRMLHWTYQRFLEIFGADKKPYLLDCAIMFLGIIHHNMKYYAMDHETNVGVHQVVRFSVNRIENIAKDLVKSGEQLNPPELLDKWLPNQTKVNFHEKLTHTLATMKKSVSDIDKLKAAELLDFIQEELLHAKNPRKYLIESTLSALKNSIYEKNQIEELEQLVSTYFTKA